MFFLFASSYMLGDKFVDGRRIEPTENKGLIERKGTIKTIEVFFFFFFFGDKKKGDSSVTVIVPRPTVQLGKPMGTTSSNWSSETPNPHTPQALLISGTFKNCNYSPRENSNLRCDETSAITYQLYHTC